MGFPSQAQVQLSVTGPSPQPIERRGDLHDKSPCCVLVPLKRCSDLKIILSFLLLIVPLLHSSYKNLPFGAKPQIVLVVTRQGAAPFRSHLINLLELHTYSVDVLKHCFVHNIKLMLII